MGRQTSAGQTKDALTLTKMRLAAVSQEGRSSPQAHQPLSATTTFFELVSCHHRIHTKCRPHFLVTAHCRLRSIISTHTGVVSDMLPICLIQGKELTCAQMHFRYLLIISIIAYCNSSWTISQVHAFTRKTYTHLIASPFKHN